MTAANACNMPARATLLLAAVLLTSMAAWAGDEPAESRDRLGCKDPAACTAAIEHERSRQDMIDAHNRRLDQVRAIGERIATQPPVPLEVPVYRP